MAKIRVYELAKELEFDKKALVNKINALDLGFLVNNYMSAISDEEAAQLKSALEREKAENTVSTRLSATVIRRRNTGTRRKVGGSDQPSSDADEVAAPKRAVVAVRSKPEVARPVSEEAAEADADARSARARAEAAFAPATAPDDSPKTEPAAVGEPEPAKPADLAPEAVEPTVPAPAGNGEAAIPERTVAPSAVASADMDASDKHIPTVDLAPAVSEREVDVPELPVSDGDGDGEALASPYMIRSTAGAANVIGRIDPSVLKARLAAEGKNFNPPDRNQRRTVTPDTSTSSNTGSSTNISAANGNGNGNGHGHATTNGSLSGPPSPDTKGGIPADPAGARRRGRRSRRSVGAEQLYDDNAKIRRMHRQRRKSKPGKTVVTQAAEHKRVIKVDEGIIISDLAHQMGVKTSQIIRDLMKQGDMYTINQAVDVETAALIAEGYDYKVENVTFAVEKHFDSHEDLNEELLKRPPVVTIMGHVDHGKTSLLDAIRKSTITAGEAGGITQHIGAYQVEVRGEMVTFLDTPGHAAFTALRARGAQATDLVILVVAADDGVMPQTVEAVNHAKAAGVPIIVAVNKIDKPGANPERVKQAMTEFELIPEEWGGQTIFSEVSALHGAGLDELLEAVILQAEILELTANPTRRAHGLVIESSLDIGRGAVATVLVQRGTLRAGDIVVAGEHFGRIRKMYDHLGVSVTEVTPSMPAEITGLSGVPNAGEQFFAVEDDRTARDIVSHVQRTNRDKEAVSRAQRPGGLAELTRMMQEGQLKELKVIVKADVQGSVEAIIGSLGKLGNEEVQVRIIHSAVGGITENDVNLAASSAEGAVIVGFNVRPESRANALAEERGIELILSSIIYDVENTIKSALEGMLAPILTEKTTGHAEVRETFIVPKVGTIAGVLIHDGRINRGTKCRVVRGGAIMTTSTIGTLKRFKDDVREVKSGFECGLSVDNFNDIKIGDTIECFEIEQHAAKLE